MLVCRESVAVAGMLRFVERFVVIMLPLTTLAAVTTAPTIFSAPTNNR